MNQTVSALCACHTKPAPPYTPNRSDSHSSVGVLWFAIFLQLFLILGVLHTLASDSIAMHRFQIATFGAVAIVFAVIGVNQGIFSGRASLDAMAAGWLILAVVDILWVLYFTSEEDSLMLHIFNSMGTGGLTPPSRRRRATRTTSMHTMGAGNGYQAGFGSTPGGMATGYDTKMASSLGGPIGSGNSFNAGSVEGPPRSLVGTGSINNVPVGGGAGSAGGGDHGMSANSPLMGGNAGVGSGGGPPMPASPGAAETSLDDGAIYKAKALYSCEYHIQPWCGFFAKPITDGASSDDPNEISFQKGEIMEIIDKQGKWWQAKKSDGTIGSKSSLSAHVERP